MNRERPGLLSRREWLKYTALSSAAAVTSGKAARAAVCADQTPIEIHEVENTGCGMREDMPLSPLILNPFSELLPVPKAMASGWRRIDGTLDPQASDAWYCRPYPGRPNGGVIVPSKDLGCQDSMGDRTRGENLPRGGTHQLWPGTPGTACQNYPDPILYHIRIQVSEHRVTDSLVRPLVRGRGIPAGDRKLPKSAIYGYNNTFAGAMINAEYGRPVCVRFENDLDLNPHCLDRQNFGAPDWGFLTHLHNGHTAPESDGNPSHLSENEGAYHPAEWSDNLYLMYPAGGDDREKQSFLWFHDHRMHHTGANIYKGMLGLMLHYDPKIDSGDERTGLRLPGVRRNNSAGTFDVDYDVPLALYDCALDDGDVRHRDQHIPKGNLCDRSHPEWWGKLFYRHQNNHGFVGDIFTVNGKAYPVLHVKRRKYRLRFLGASVARCYELWLMKGQIGAFPGQQGQWNFVTNSGGSLVRSRGQQCMRMTQIAVDGGLLPNAIVRDSCEIWPAKRREFVVDFTKYLDGSPTSKGDVIYLANTMQMPDGRKPVFSGEGEFDEKYCVPMLKIVIGDDAPDHSVMPAHGSPLRQMPPYLPTAVRQKARFELSRGDGGGDEGQWVINGLAYDPLRPLHKVKLNSAEVWTVENGGGGWTHPMHIHQEEHRTLSRRSSRRSHPDDTGKEDVIALDAGEEVTIYRKFRTFAGKYVAHCHNLAHEDHKMMFGWIIEP
jgi:FtsP/CotA-like multicopper oxidase with cupredoxin domain